MQTTRFLFGAVALFVGIATAGAVAIQDDPATARQSADDSPAAKRAALEKDFIDTMTDARLIGTWQMTMGDATAAPHQLTDPQPESYTISKVEKTGDSWIITARIQYAGKDAEVPVLVRVVWSGDTPIITVDDLAIPVFGTYSARVMIYRGFYAGTWFGKGYAGVLSGRIVKISNADTTKKDAKPQQSPAPDSSDPSKD